MLKQYIMNDLSKMSIEKIESTVFKAKDGQRYALKKVPRNIPEANVYGMEYAHGYFWYKIDPPKN